MPSYSYEKCLERSYRINWRIEDVLESYIDDVLVDAPDELLHLAADETGELPAIPVGPGQRPTAESDPIPDPSATPDPSEV